MEYAPITITTLNRYEHFVRCIQSLENNGLAKETELFISVDFPPSEKYKEGYQKIISFLKEKQFKFKKTHIFYQRENKGTMENYIFIMNEAFKKFDRAIFLEDDNEVAPCFLEFCDKGLDTFENDKDIVGFNASNYVWCGTGYEPKIKKNVEGNNVKKRQLLFHAYATWKESWIQICQYCQEDKIYSIGKNRKLMSKLHKKSKAFFYEFIDAALTSHKSKLPWSNNKLYPIDLIWDIFMMLEDKYIIYPVISQVRDWGIDGSGANYKEKFENMDQIVSTPIDESRNFPFQVEDEIEIDKEEIQLHDKYKFTSIRVKLIKLFKYALFLLKE